jgi:hypothetical protein
MAEGDTYVEQAEVQRRRFLRSRSREELPMQMLKMGPTNRIVSVRMAKLTMRWMMLYERLNWSNPRAWDWMVRFVKMLEEYQLTVGEPKNSRMAFQEMFNGWLAQEKSREKQNSTGV